MDLGFFGIMNRVEPDEAEKPIRVLLVDDDEDYFVLMHALFSDIGSPTYELDWTTTYDDALAALQSAQYDVCLLDYQLGGRDGIEILREARARGHRLPMIILTGHGDRQVDLEAMAAGAADYLYKAKVDAPLLERSIRYAIDQTRTTDTLRENESRLAALYEQEQARGRELEHAYAELRRAEAMRDDLAHMIIHDLHGPLTSIMLNLDLIGKRLSQRADDESLPALKNARASANRMAWMIDDLLNVSKLEAGELRLNVTTISLAAVLAEKQVTYRARLEAEGKVLAIQAPADLPAIMADAELIGRVLDNLVDNAIKYSPPGGHIEISAEARDQAVKIDVRDDGEGILPDDRDRIFDKFVQGSAAGARPARHGAGLGLAFCRLAVVAHGGTIMATSEPGHGATFTVTLPIGR